MPGTSHECPAPAGHPASATDLRYAQAIDKAAVAYALKGRNGAMPTIQHVAGLPYRWMIVPAPLTEIANAKKACRRSSFIDADGTSINPACRRYLAPLIRGEAVQPWRDDGLPRPLAAGCATVKKRVSASEA